MKTYSQKPSEISRRWVLFDASELPLGRLSTMIATHLTGKYKPTYTPHMDGGDYVVVINAANLVVTGDKETGKIYYRHSGFPGGIKDASLKEVREGLEALHNQFCLSLELIQDSLSPLEKRVLLISR